MKKLLAVAVGLGAVATGFAQTISLTNFSTGYVENFDSLPNTGTTSISGNVFSPFLPGWVYANSATSIALLRTGTGSSNTGGLYSFGAASSSERALGSLASGTPGNIQYGMRLSNNTGLSTGTAVVQFDLEQWRDGGNTSAGTPSLQQGLTISYKLLKGGSGYTAADFGAGTGFETAAIWLQSTTTADTTLSSLSAPVNTNSILGPTFGNSTTAGTALDGNLVANSTRYRAVIQLFSAGESFDPGDELVFRVEDINNVNNDHAFSLDNVVVVPEPASFLAIGLGIVGLAARRRRKN